MNTNPKPYQFYLTDGASYYFVDSSGNVMLVGAAIELKFAPVNWMDLSVSFERGFTYYGMFRMYSTPFEFIKDGAQIIRKYNYLVDGIETKMYLKIRKFNYTLAVWDYQDFLYCELDFSTLNDTFDRVGINLIEGGFASKLKARENTTYEMDIVDDPNRVWVKMDGLKLDCIVNWGILTASFPQAFTAIYLPLSYYTTTEGTNLKLGIYSVDPPSFQRFIIKNDSNTTISIDMKTVLECNIIMSPSNTALGQVRVSYDILQLSPLAFISHNNIYTLGGLAAGSTTALHLNQVDTIVLPTNQGIDFSIIVDDGLGGGGTNGYQVDILDGCKLTASYWNRKDATYIPALRPAKVYQNLVSKIGDALTLQVSNLLNVTHNTKVITSGDAIRNLLSSKLKINFSDFYKSINSVLSASLYYNRMTNVAYLESKSSVFSATVIAVIDEVNNFSAKTLTAEMFAKLKMGFGSYSYEENNGKDEFNQSTEFLTPLTKVQAEKDLTSPIRADMYGIEYTRLNLTSKVTTDADSDNDSFFIHIDSTSSGNVPAGNVGAGEPYYNLYRKPLFAIPSPNYWVVNNLAHADTAFNFFFSAKRQLARWGNYISSLLFLQGTKKIKFQSNTKNNAGNTKLQTIEGISATVIDEGSDELISNYAPSLFMPILFEFDYAEKYNLFGVIDANPHGVVQFKYKGNTYEGFIIKITTKPYLQKQSCTLLASTNNDLTKLETQ